MTRPLTSLLVALVLTACGESKTVPPEITLKGEAMGTTWTVKVRRSPVDEATLAAAIAETIARVERVASHWDPASPLSRFNDSTSTEAFPIPAELADLVRDALFLARSSEGAFDPTVGNLADLWGFGPKGNTAPPPDGPALAEALARTGHEHLLVDGDTLAKDLPDLRLDLSAFAKGYAIDRVAEKLIALPLLDFLIEFGGEFSGSGTNASGQAWNVGIRTPAPDAPGAIARTLALDHAAVATSGTYFNFHGDAAHILDPRTGRPLPALPYRSVTVIAPFAATADALATALLVLDQEKGDALAREFEAEVIRLP